MGKLKQSLTESQEVELGLYATLAKFDRAIEDLANTSKELHNTLEDLFAPHCTKCGDMILGDTDALCQNCV